MSDTKKDETPVHYLGDVKMVLMPRDNKPKAKEEKEKLDV